MKKVNDYMIRWIKFFCLILLLDVSGSSQGLFSYENSLQFADYLFESGQFSLASEEYERVVFLNPHDSASIGRLLESYRMQNRSELGLKRAGQLIGDRDDLPVKLFSQIYYLEMENKRFEEAEQLVKLQSNLDDTQKNLAHLGLAISQNKWNDARSYYLNHQMAEESPYYTSLGNIIQEYSSKRKKSPLLAATLSTIIPGAGKAYTGRWADGAIALVFIGSNAWQSYRGFEKDGIKSVRGWVFGAIGFGFWVGNIYGSYQTARQHNQSVMQKYHDKASDIIYYAF
ncbi:MAG TPA: hypothetical protein DCX89_06490 [Saprospirales bacterium]|nr:hypothetical protein [Saprospirales bacterium]HAY71520.1 hypothetical protein [Saprospirales bacterium]